jgi:hypothetical protein
MERELLMVAHSDIDHTGLTGIPSGNTVATDTIWDAAGDSAWGTGANTAAKLSYGSNGQAVIGTAGTGAWKNPPGFILSQVRANATISVTATTEATANTVITAAAVTLDGSTDVDVEFGAPFAGFQATSGAHLIVYLYDGSTSLGIIWQGTNNAAVTLRTGGIYVTTPLAGAQRPSAAAHTYSIRAITGSGTATIAGGVGGAGQYQPMYVRVKQA